MESLTASRIQLCGHLTVELEGRRVESRLPSRQGRLLFAYLVLNRDRPARRDELIDVLWPGEPPADAPGALNTLLSRLRRGLGPDVVAGKHEVSLQLPPGIEIDVELASAALKRAQAAAGDRDWQAAWGPAHASLAIAQRGLLPGLSAPWLEHPRAELEDVELVALELVAETGLGLGGGELGAAERSARTLIERAPFRESGYRLQMRALAARGNVAEALRTYEELRQLLREQLGTSPSAELVALHRTLLDGGGAEGRTGFARPSSVSPEPGARLFVGRSGELRALEQALADAEAGRRRLVLVVGEAGIGKTRLAEELTRAATAGGWDVAWGRCTEGNGAPVFWPWLEMLRRLAADRSPERLRRALGGGAADVAQIVPDLHELFPDLEPHVSGDPAAARFRLFDSVDRFLVRIATATPLVLVLDDLQWADPPSLELLRHVASRPDRAHILLVGTYRAAEVEERELVAGLADEAAARRFELSGLREADVRELLAGAAEASDAVVEAVHRRTDGNPFFVTQLIEQLDASPDQELALVHDVPGGVRDVIRHRLARLPAPATQLLTAASVIGEEFELRPLSGVTEVDGQVLELVEAAVRHGFVIESPAVAGRFRFAHALIREALYGQLGGMARARLHRRVGEELERLYGDDGDHLTDLAHHFHEAAAEGETDRAHRYAVRAAEQAAARLGYEQAEMLLRRALGLLERSAPGRERVERELDLQVRLGGLLMMTRGYASSEVGAACARATELCRAGEVGTEEQLFGSLWRLGVYYEVRGDFATSRALGEQLLELAARSEQASTCRIGGGQLVAVASLEEGDPDSAREHLLEVRTLADSMGDASAGVFGMDFRVTSRGFLGWATSLLGDDDDGARLAAESVALAHRGLSRHDEAFGLFAEAICALLRRDARTARGRAEGAVAVCDAHGFRLFGAMAAMIEGWAVSEAGDPDAGVARISAGLDAYTATGAGMMTHFFLALLAEAQQRSGRAEMAVETVERGMTALATSGRFYEAELHRLRGELLVALRPESDEGPESLRTALAVARRQRAGALERRAAASLEGLAIA